MKAAGKWTVKIALTVRESPSVFLPTIADDLAVSSFAPAPFRLRETRHRAAPVGARPLEFQEQDPGVSATFVANNAYWQGKPTFAGWNVIFFSSATAQQAALLSGQIDAVDSPAAGRRRVGPGDREPPRASKWCDRSSSATPCGSLT